MVDCGKMNWGAYKIITNDKVTFDRLIQFFIVLYNLTMSRYKFY